MWRLWALRYQAVELVLVLVGIGFLVVPEPVAQISLLAAWDVLALANCVVRWLRGRAHRVAEDDPGDGPPEWLHSLLGRRIGLVVTMLTSLIGLAGGLLILAARAIFDDSSPDLALTSIVLQVCSAAAVLMAWLLLHFGYADRYAHLYYRQPGGPVLGFPETDRPNLLDFAYFSFTVGTSFAASDVEVRARSIRYTVLVHSILSFFYNAAILSIAIGVTNI